MHPLPATNKSYLQQRRTIESVLRRRIPLWNMQRLLCPYQYQMTCLYHLQQPFPHQQYVIQRINPFNGGLYSVQTPAAGAALFSIPFPACCSQIF